MSNALTAIVSRDFSRTTLAALRSKGIRIVDVRALPDSTGSCLNSERGYCLDDNGTGRVRTHSGVVELANAPAAPKVCRCAFPARVVAFPVDRCSRCDRACEVA